MMEDKEFIDNIDDILTVDGIGSLSSGPGDYSLSIGVQPDDYEVDEAFQFLVEKAKNKNLPVLTAVLPSTFQPSKKLFEMGVNFQVLGADIAFIASGFEAIMNDIICKLR
jgi:4-hydroxy-2-oxoheptanedioate aldolase